MGPKVPCVKIIFTHSKNLFYTHKKLEPELLYMENSIVPHIEENIPLPKNAAEAFPALSPTEELQHRANVIKLVSDLTGVPIAPTADNAKEAMDIAKMMMENPEFRPNFAIFPTETQAYLAGVVARTNVALVDDLAELKMYVVNRLVQEVETSKDPKTRLTALSKLGEVDGVDAFKKRTEMTVKHQTMEEVEKELFELINSVENKVIDVEAREIVNKENNG
jgi:hypothetical protein